MCHEQDRVTAATVVDHIIPHKLKEALRSGDNQAIAKAQKFSGAGRTGKGFVSKHHDSNKAAHGETRCRHRMMRAEYHSTLRRTGSNDNDYQGRVGGSKVQNLAPDDRRLVLLHNREMKVFFREVPMAGRRLKPSHLKVVTGNPGKRKLNDKEPTRPEKSQSPPAHLTDWGKVAGKTGQCCLMVWGFSLLQTCWRWSAFAIFTPTYSSCALRSLTRENVYSADGWRFLIKANPAVAMLADADRRFKSYLVEFGLTPAARTKVKVDGGEKKKTHSTSSSVDPATQYAMDVTSGKVIAGPDIRNACQRHFA